MFLACKKYNSFGLCLLLLLLPSVILHPRCLYRLVFNTIWPKNPSGKISYKWPIFYIQLALAMQVKHLCQQLFFVLGICYRSEIYNYLVSGLKLLHVNLYERMCLCFWCSDWLHWTQGPPHFAFQPIQTILR